LERTRKQRKAAKAGGKQRSENSAPELDRVRKAAERYRRNNPDAPARQMARDLSQSLEMPVGTVRDRLRKLANK
jgi:hypothetical protein